VHKANSKRLTTAQAPHKHRTSTAPRAFTHRRTTTAQQAHRDRTESEPVNLEPQPTTVSSLQRRGEPIKLVPSTPPGRSTAKARAFAHDIHTLRAQGFTFEAIRQALASAGVHVSNTTVQREAARALRGAASRPAAAKLQPGNAPPPPSPGAVQASDLAADRPGLRNDGRQLAESFMRQQITNPLLRAKEPR
jgi:hypothetical protein